MGRYTTEAEIDYAIDISKKATIKLRELSPLWDMHKDGIDIDKVNWLEH